MLKNSLHATGTEYLIPTLTYEYDKMGNRIAETGANGNTVNYGYDLLGRQITITAKVKDILADQTVEMITKNYYDAAGNKVKTVDPNNGEWKYTYSARGYLLSEEDPAHNITRYQYDVLGNKSAVTDPRGNGTDGKFTTWYLYDDLNRLHKTILPDTSPSDQSDNPYVEITFDEVGNKLTERDPNGVETSYTYTSRYWLEKVYVNEQLKATFTYDKKGNRIKVEDALHNVTKNVYDSLGRVRQVIHPLGNDESFSYDQVGNRTAVTDGRGYTTEYSYNSLGWLTGVRDALLNLTQYQYDLNGNQVKAIAANNLVTKNRYDELNRLVEQVDSLNNSTKFSYDLNGNRKKMVDRRGSTWEYQYYSNNLLKQLDVTNGTESYYVEYTYDAAGNRKEVTDSGNTVKYNFEGGVHQPDPLNRINNISRNFDGATYRTAYEYDWAGLLTKIKYPEATGWLEYNYNTLNQLKEVVGFTNPNGITYQTNGALNGISYVNGVTASYGYDNNNRLNNLQVSFDGKDILKLGYTYDNSNNITMVNDGGKLKTFEYDANNQLTKAVTPGKFMETAPASGTCGLKVDDFYSSSSLDLMPTLSGLMGLDYNTSSIGLDFGAVAQGVKKILLVPDQSYKTHRITARTLDLYISNDNATYAPIPATGWEYAKDSNGVITLTLKEAVSTRYLKLHVYFDDLDANGKPKNKAQFLNELARMLQVYQEASSKTEEYQYDKAGNRTLLRVTLVHSKDYNSQYYPNSDRLKTDGKYTFTYDDNGNMTGKTGQGESWTYKYDLLNRLIEVAKNGTIKATYGYDPNGLRVVKKANGDTIHYVFEGTEPIFEKRITDGRTRSYVYALGQHLARVDGVIGNTSASIYYYHTDHLGSVRAVTDVSGKVVYNADYQAFGTQFMKDGEFEELHGFTGKEYDPDVGLYYFNARWYDPDLGRFISEDPAADPNNPNLYSYCNNNPIMFTDPSGMWLGAALSWLWKSIIIPVWNYIIAPYLTVSTWNGLQAGYQNMKDGGSFWTGFFGAFRSFNLTFNINFGNGTTSYSLTCDYIPGITTPDPYLSWEAQQARMTADWNEYLDQITRTQESDYEFQAQLAVAKWQAEEEAKRQRESIDPLEKCNGTVSAGINQPKNVTRRSHGTAGSWDEETSISDTIAFWVSTGLYFVPIVGQGICIAEAGTGRSFYDGETLPGWQRVLVGTAGILGLGAFKFVRASDDIVTVGIKSLRFDLQLFASNSRLTAKQSTDLAKYLGFTKTKYFIKGQPVFTNGKVFISPDVDSHIGGVWKMGKSIEDLLREGKRMGTYDALLNKIGK